MRRTSFLIVILLIVTISTFAQKARYQSEIIFRLSQHVTWPENDDNYKFVIGVVGSKSDFESFQ